MGIKKERIAEMLQSKRGRNFLVFLSFLCLSAILWLVRALDEETQRDMRCTVKITHVPDSLVMITPLPENINVSVRARGTMLLKYLLKKDPELVIDYRTYHTGEEIVFSPVAMRSFLRNSFGNAMQVQAATPDSLRLLFTSRPGVEMCLKPNVKAEAAQQYTVMGQPILSTDSVKVYAQHGTPLSMKWVTTQPVHLTNLRDTRTVRVAVDVPQGMRAVPDSVDVTISVEPLISKTRNVAVTPVNVPSYMKLIPIPSHVDVYYIVPLSIYKSVDSNPKFVVEADYSAVDGGSDKLPLKLTKAPKDFLNVFLSTDSVSFVLELK